MHNIIYNRQKYLTVKLAQKLIIIIILNIINIIKKYQFSGNNEQRFIYIWKSDSYLLMFGSFLFNKCSSGIKPMSTSWLRMMWSVRTMPACATPLQSGIKILIWAKNRGSSEQVVYSATLQNNHNVYLTFVYV